MSLLLETQTNPEIDAADGRFFINTGLDVLRSSMVSRMSAIRQGRKTRSPLVDDEIFEFHKERKEFEELATVGKGIFRLAFSGKLTANSESYLPLIDDYAIEGPDGVSVVEFSSVVKTATKLTPGHGGAEFDYPLMLNLRVQTSSDVGPKVFSPDWTQGPDVPRSTEQTSDGRWYSFPLEDVQINLLEQLT